MKLADFERLKKFMGLAESPNDGEALNALRMANKLLAANGGDWAKVLARTITLEVEGDVVDATADRASTSAAEAERKREREERIDGLFATALDGAGPGRFRDFLLDVQKQWEKKRWLSKDQYDALASAASKAARR